MLNIRNPKIVFMHIPKTGGTSVHTAIKRHYRHQTYYIDPVKTQAMAKLIYCSVPGIDKGTYLLRDGFALDAMQRDFAYISGHIHFNRDIWKAYSDQYHYVTLLREPVSRYISAYFFNASKEPGSHSYNPFTLSELIKNSRGVRLGHFYLNYFSGFPLEKDYDFNNLSARIEVAKDNLSKLDLIGFLEDIDVFKVKFKQKFGIRLRIPHKNKNPVPKPVVEPKIVEKIRELCWPDIEIYEFAKSQFYKNRT
jgi:hypothetical protein